MIRPSLLLTAAAISAWVASSPLAAQAQSSAQAAAISVQTPLASPLGSELPVSTVAQAVAASVGTEVVLRGTIQRYQAPPSDRAPHKFFLRDSTGELPIAVWQQTWAQIGFARDLREGAEVTVLVNIRLFRGKTEGHVETPSGLKLGYASMTAIGPIQWMADVTAGVRAAADNGRKILVFFTTPESESSRFLDEEIFSDKKVREAIASRYNTVKIDMGKNPALAQQLKVFRSGTLVIYDERGSFVRQIGTIRRVDDLLRGLE